MKEWNIKEYSNGYRIGQMDENDELHGFGYSYFSETNTFHAGEWVHGERNGWFLNNDSTHPELTYFRYLRNGEIVDGYGWLLTSSSKGLSIHQSFFWKDNNTYDEKGFCFRVFSDKGWCYRFIDPAAKVQKWVVYAKERITIATVWTKDHKIISKQVILEGDYEVPFHYFHQTPIPNARFEAYDDGVWPKTSGPTVQEGDGRCTTNIGHLRTGSTYFCGLLYTSTHDDISIDHEYEGYIDGGKFTTNRFNRNWTYSYFKDDEFQGTEVCWDNKTSTLEIRKYNYGDDHTYDCVQIDEDFNVTQKQAYDEKTQKSENEEYFDFDSSLTSNHRTKHTSYNDALEDENEEYDPSPKVSKKRKTSTRIRVTPNKKPKIKRVRVTPKKKPK